MDRRREQVFVGLFVIVAAALLLATVFVLSGAFSHSAPSYKAKFPYAGGLEEGSFRYGMRAARRWAVWRSCASTPTIQL